MYLNLLVQTVPWENLWTVIENIIYRFASTEHEVKTTLWCFNVNEKLLCYILFCILSSNIRMDNFVSFRPQVLRKKVSVTCHSDCGFSTLLFFFVYLAPNPKKLSAFWDFWHSIWVGLSRCFATILEHSGQLKTPGLELLQNPGCLSGETLWLKQKKERQ